MKLCTFGVKTPLGLIERVGVFTVQGVIDATAASLGIELAANTAQALVKPYWKGNPDAVVGPETVLSRPPYADVLDVELKCAFLKSAVWSIPSALDGLSLCGARGTFTRA